MNTKLSKWTKDTKKWREQNGCTTPEWKMYVANRNNMICGVAIICFFYGIAVGFFIGWVG